eukprot:1993851-Prymnesium_polylepis.1
MNCARARSAAAEDVNVDCGLWYCKVINESATHVLLDICSGRCTHAHDVVVENQQLIIAKLRQPAPQRRILDGAGVRRTRLLHPGVLDILLTI